MENHFFASANSCKGFKNLFNNIGNGYTYILKGGPGTGKSSLMKRFGSYYANKGYDVEYFYCSSDNTSLDGVNIPQLKVCIVDGTAPHITEATMPKIKEEILNVGQYIKEDIKKHRTQIEKNLAEKSKCFSLAYKYLFAVGELFEIEKELCTINQVEEKFLLKEIKIKEEKTFKQRKLFASYLSKNGIEFIYNKNDYKKVIILKDNIFSNYNLLKKLSQKLSENKKSHTCFMSLLNPDTIESICVDNILILSFDPSKDIFCNFVNKNILKMLTKKAGSLIEKAKYYHKNVEKYYVKNMNFEELNKFISKKLNIT